MWYNPIYLIHRWAGGKVGAIGCGVRKETATNRIIEPDLTITIVLRWYKIHQIVTISIQYSKFIYITNKPFCAVRFIRIMRPAKR